MAFSKGKESSEGSSVQFKKFVGVGSVKVLAVNPNKDEWDKLMGTTSTEERSYIGDKEGVKYARVTFVVEIDPNRSIDGATGIIPLTFWLRKQAIKGANSGKIKVIDKFGQTAWATEEDIQAKRIPQYTNGPANIDIDYRKCISGEEELTTFLKALMCIPSPRTFVDGKWVTIPDTSNCEARLDKVMKYFDGDFSEIKSIIKAFPNNKARVLFGVKENEGKQYQDFLTSFFMMNGSSNNTKFQKKLMEELAIGRYANTYFGEKDNLGNVMTTDIKEYTVVPTTYSDSTADTTPFTVPEPSGPAVTATTDSDDLPF